MNIQFIKRQFETDKSLYTGNVKIHKGSLIGVMKKYCRSDGDYRLALKALTGKTSSKVLSEAEFYALYQLVLPNKPTGGHWQSGREDMDKIIDSLVNSTVDVPEQVSFLEPADVPMGTFEEINHPFTRESPFNPNDWKSTPKESE